MDLNQKQRDSLNFADNEEIELKKENSGIVASPIHPSDHDIDNKINNDVLENNKSNTFSTPVVPSAEYLIVTPTQPTPSIEVSPETDTHSAMIRSPLTDSGSGILDELERLDKTIEVSPQSRCVTSPGRPGMALKKDRMKLKLRRRSARERRLTASAGPASAGSRVTAPPTPTRRLSPRSPPKRILREYKPPPRYIGVYKEKVMVCEAVQFIWRVIYEYQRENPFSDAVVGVSGGSTPRKTFETLAAMYGAISGVFCFTADSSKESISSDTSAAYHSDPESFWSRIEWKRVKLFLVDERYVPPFDSSSNQKMIRETLLADDLIDIPEENLYFPNTLLPLKDCVADYNDRLGSLLTVSGRPCLVTLGMGDDGHIASWFPPLSNTDYQDAHSMQQFVFHTQQDRFEIRNRITVSLSVIDSASEKLFLLSGESKVTKWKTLMTLPTTIAHINQEPVLQVLESGNTTVISYPPIVSDAFKQMHDANQSCHLSVVIFGASGDLARKKTIPALFSLFCEGRLPENFHIVGYSRTALSNTDFWKTVEPYLWNLDSFFKGSARHQQALIKQASPAFLDEFKKRLIYMQGAYDDETGFGRLGCFLDSLDAPLCGASSDFDARGNRLFYLALPPTVFATTIAQARQHAWSHSGWNRVVVEKPFGRDLESANSLANRMLLILKEDETYRIDHYLGKEMVLNLMVFRFANAAFSPLMSWQFISAVRITFKETIGTSGRGGYFDQFGIIRDIMQNHLLQILTIVAMERPASLKDDDIRDEKVKVLKQIQSLSLDKTVIGQYTASSDGRIPGYLEDPTVPKDSLCPTFCTTVLYINNERWAGVPFILKAGKALEERLTEIRIQLRSVPGNLFGDNVPQNELVVRIQPSEAIYMKVMAKNPGLGDGLTQTELDLTVMDRFDVDRMPDAYERLLVDVIKGDKQNFVRTDELKEAWRIFTPLLHELEAKQIRPTPYTANSRGPEEAYELINTHGYKRYEGYTWVKL